MEKVKLGLFNIHIFLHTVQISNAMRKYFLWKIVLSAKMLMKQFFHFLCIFSPYFELFYISLDWLGFAQSNFVEMMLNSFFSMWKSLFSKRFAKYSDFWSFLKWPHLPHGRNSTTRLYLYQVCTFCCILVVGFKKA